jgi:hypothetical protein
MADGELAAVFKGLAKDAAEAAGKITESVAKLSEQTADIEESNLAHMLETDAKSADDISRLRDAKGRWAPNPDKEPGPSWTDADRRREWRRIANDPDSPLTPAERAQVLRTGRGPRRRNPYTGEMETMELSHEPVPLRDGGTEVVPAWPDDHAARDPHRKLKGGRQPHQYPEE